MTPVEMTPVESWETISAAHRAKQQQAIPQDWVLASEDLDNLKGTGASNEGKLIQRDVVAKSGLLSQKEIGITETLTARELLGKLSQGRLSSVEVVRAFCKRAALAQQLTSCLTEIFFKDALERAEQLDRQLRETGKPAGPLHGLPISLKDSYRIAGRHATAGYVEFLRRPVFDEDAAVVKLLLAAGAVLYCKTNVPQTMMTADSENNIFGRTLNPHNTALTAGGSTGGEGALIAFRGSVLGVGSDIAGSIRIPSLCCGIYGFKPTTDRVPFAGQSNAPFATPHFGGIKPAAGPMANSVDDLALFMEAVVGQRPWQYDASAHDLPWRALPDRGARPLTIGLLPEDAEYQLHPPVRRALASAASILEKAGHKIVRLPAEPSRSIALGGKIGFHFFFLGGPSLSTLSELMGEPLVKSVAIGVHPFSDGKFLVSQEADLSQQFTEWTSASETYAASWKNAWLQYDLDILLAPGAISTAVPHDEYGNPVYTLAWNVLDYPAGIIPFGAASKTLDPEAQRGTEAFDADYDPEVYDGAPCSVQVVAPRFRDEECLEAMRIIDDTLRLHSL